jgi:predicted nuclease of predicted toxin-antitoxin system
MRLFADENLEFDIVEVLRGLGHDVKLLAPENRGSHDPEVLALATSDDRVFLTNDKDFAELAFLQRQLTSGIVLVRLPHLQSEAKARRVAKLIDEQRDNLHGFFTVIESAGIRRRPFLSLLK